MSAFNTQLPSPLIRGEVKRGLVTVQEKLCGTPYKSKRTPYPQ